MLRGSGVSDKGQVRPTNEDRFAVRDDLGLFVIADGMGGHNAGELAATMAVDLVVAFCAAQGPRCFRARSSSAEGPDGWPFSLDPSLTSAGNLLRTAILLANEQIRERAAAQREYAGMGTTIVAAAAADGRLTVAHVGDSRLYILSRGGLRQITHDDSWLAATLAHDPGLDPAALRRHPMRHALTSVVGGQSRTDVHVVEEKLLDDDVLLLTTDGVHGVLDDRQIARLMLEEREPKAMAERLVATALACGTRDNSTAIVVRDDTSP